MGISLHPGHVWTFLYIRDMYGHFFTSGTCMDISSHPGRGFLVDVCFCVVFRGRGYPTKFFNQKVRLSAEIWKRYYI